MNIPWKIGSRSIKLRFLKINLINYTFHSTIRLNDKKQLQQSHQQWQQQQQQQFLKYNALITKNVWDTNNNLKQKQQQQPDLKQEQRLQEYQQQYSDYSSKPAASSAAAAEKTKKSDDENEKIPSTPDPDHQSEKRTLPRLMNFPEVMWPSIINTVRNWILVQFIIRPYFDRDFYLKDFIKGAKKAMQVVSVKLMNGDFKSLDDLVTADALAELKPVIQKLSVSQRRQLEVRDSDIYLTFPYQVGIMFDDNNENKIQKRWVEITMVFHVLRGLQEIRESGEEIPWNMGTVPEYQDKMFVCNYRFVKEFTMGQESNWIINVVNHFKPIDLINEMKNE